MTPSSDGSPIGIGGCYCKNDGSHFDSHKRECRTRLFSLATCVCFIEGKGTLGKSELRALLPDEH